MPFIRVLSEVQEDCAQSRNAGNSHESSGVTVKILHDTIGVSGE
jgi:hypothetical protein